MRQLVGGVLEIVQPRSQGQDTRTTHSKYLDTTFVRRSGRLPAVALSLVAHSRGLGSINVAWCRRRIELRPLWDHQVCMGPWCSLPNAECTRHQTAALVWIELLCIVSYVRKVCSVTDRTTVCVCARACVLVCVYVCVRACLYIHVCMCVNGGFWRALKWGGGLGLVSLKRCANVALESPEVGFIPEFDGFYVVSRVGAIGGFVLLLLPLFLLLLLLLLPLLLLLLLLLLPLLLLRLLPLLFLSLLLPLPLLLIIIIILYCAHAIGNEAQRRKR